MGTPVAGMSSLLGEYNCKLDVKGRLKMPAGLKRQFHPDDKGRFVIKRGIDACLELYSWSEWQRHSAKVKARLNPFREDHRTFERIYFSGATELEMDSSDRVLVPRALIDHAGFGKEIVLSARNSKVELWDKSRYESAVTMDSKDFASLAEDVMGTFDDGE